jgi:hypothetical protein
MRKNLSTYIVLALQEVKDKLEAEIADLQAQLAEVNDFLGSEDAEPQPETPAENVPQRTIPEPASSTNAQDEVTFSSTPTQYTSTVNGKFNSGAYTDAGKRLPDKFDLYQLRETLGVDRKAEHAVITAWTRREWITRCGHGRYEKTKIFGHNRPLAHLEEEVRPAVSANKKEQLEAKLLDLERQHDDCVDGSVQQEILADKIETLEAEIGQLDAAI